MKKKEIVCFFFFCFETLSDFKFLFRRSLGIPFTSGLGFPFFFSSSFVWIIQREIENQLLNKETSLFFFFEFETFINRNLGLPVKYEALGGFTVT